MNKKVYVAGPYSRGDTINNIQAALTVAEHLWFMGYVPFVPHLTGFWHFLYPHRYEEWMEYDAQWLMTCDAVIRLPGDSEGADREVDMAKSANIPVFYTVEELCTSFQQSSPS
jgi:hypothetical protein